MPWFFILLSIFAAPDHKDYSPDNTSWNGISKFYEIIKKSNIKIHFPKHFAWDKHSPGSTSIVFLSPETEIPHEKLAVFLHAGGKVLVADDFRKGTKIFNILGLKLIPEKNPFAEAVPVDNSNLLTFGVNRIETNHAASFEFARIPLFGFPDSERALFAVIHVGKGILYLLSDPSIFINDMITRENNKKLTENILYTLQKNNRNIYILTKFTESGWPAGKKPDSSGKSDLKKIILEIYEDLSNFLGYNKMGLRILAIIFLIPFLYVFLYFGFYSKSTSTIIPPVPSSFSARSKEITKFMAFRDILYEKLEIKKFVSVLSDSEIKAITEKLDSPSIKKEVRTLLKKYPDYFLDSYEELMKYHSISEISELTEKIDNILRKTGY